VVATPQVGPVGSERNYSVTPEVSTPIAFNWSFGDGGWSSAPAPSHIFRTAGAFATSVRLEFASNTSTWNRTYLLTVVADEAGTEPLEATILATPPGLTSTYCQADRWTSTLTLVAAGGIPSFSYHWEFGDGHTASSSSGTNQTHAYSFSQGSAVATVIVTDSNGSSATGYLKLYAPDMPGAGVTMGCPSSVILGIAIVLGTLLLVAVAMYALLRHRGKQRKPLPPPP
jgi:hypothetical protein